MSLFGYLIHVMFQARRYSKLKDGEYFITWVDDSFNVHNEKGVVTNDVWRCHYPKERTCLVSDLPQLNNIYAYDDPFRTPKYD